MIAVPSNTEGSSDMVPNAVCVSSPSRKDPSPSLKDEHIDPLRHAWNHLSSASSVSRSPSGTVSISSTNSDTSAHTTTYKAPSDVNDFSFPELVSRVEVSMLSEFEEHPSDSLNQFGWNGLRSKQLRSKYHRLVPFSSFLKQVKLSPASSPKSRSDLGSIFDFYSTDSLPLKALTNDPTLDIHEHPFDRNSPKHTDGVEEREIPSLFENFSMSWNPSPTTLPRQQPLTDDLGTYILYLVPGVDYCRRLDAIRKFVGSVLGHDESFVYPIHCSLSSFFQVAAPQSASAAPQSASAAPQSSSSSSSSSSSLPWNISKAALQNLLAERVIKTVEENWRVAPGAPGLDLHRSPNKASPISFSSVSTTASESFSSPIKQRQATTKNVSFLVPPFFVEHSRHRKYDSSTTQTTSRSSTSTSSTADDLLVANQNLQFVCLNQPGGITIPWTLDWLTNPNSVGNSNEPSNAERSNSLLSDLCAELSAVITDHGLPLKGDRGIQETSPIRAKPAGHTTLTNRRSNPIKLDDPRLQHFAGMFDRAVREMSTNWDLVLYELNSPGNFDERLLRVTKGHDLREVVRVENVAQLPLPLCPS